MQIKTKGGKMNILEIKVIIIIFQLFLLIYEIFFGPINTYSSLIGIVMLLVITIMLSFVKEARTKH